MDCVQEDAITVACKRMHQRLIQWGRIIIVGGNGARQKWDSDSTREHYDFTAAENDAAYHLHILVGQLPEVRHRFVLPAFYRHVEADVWRDLTPKRQAQIIGEKMAPEVNKGLRAYTQATGQWLPQVAAHDFEPIRARAIRQLVNRESLTP